jgi:GT2 family glycosyltransferase
MNISRTDILIIGVIYNTYPETLRYLDSLSRLATGNIAVVLADNSDQVKPPDFRDKIKACPFVQYFETGKNLGYFGGAREGLQCYLQKYSTYPQWVLVTNVDIVFTHHFFDRLNGLNGQQDLGIVAPSIISQKWNVDYNPKIAERYSKERIQFYQFLYSSFLIHNLFLLGAYMKKWILGLQHRNKANAEYPVQKVRKIYAPHGSCLVFNRNYFIRGGTLDLPNFLFGEEVLVAETALHLGLDVEYHPELIVNDHEHASVGFFVTPRINEYYRESNQSILDRYYIPQKNSGIVNK